MKKALILIGWFQKTDGNWYPWLKKELEKKGYQVFVPDLPTIRDDAMDMQKQLEFIEKTLTIDKETIVIGHSIGAVLALRLAEKHEYQKAILIAGWDYDDLTEGQESFWPNKVNHQLVKQNVKEIYCLASSNDPYHTAVQIEDMNRRLGGIYLLVNNAGHFLERDGRKEIPQIIDWL